MRHATSGGHQICNGHANDRMASVRDILSFHHQESDTKSSTMQRPDSVCLARRVASVISPLGQREPTHLKQALLLLAALFSLSLSYHLAPSNFSRDAPGCLRNQGRQFFSSTLTVVPPPERHIFPSLRRSPLTRESGNESHD